MSGELSRLSWAEMTLFGRDGHLSINMKNVLFSRMVAPVLGLHHHLIDWLYKIALDPLQGVPVSLYNSFSKHIAVSHRHSVGSSVNLVKQALKGQDPLEAPQRWSLVMKTSLTAALHACPLFAVPTGAMTVDLTAARGVTGCVCTPACDDGQSCDRCRLHLVSQSHSP
ncbi:hypothetical protein C0Q70_18370 [Pomacea canaliculata]|uniref:Uncharacterized protein n=1 Tax=Pomacea canaliculata TaxID=400727 RepID=A0A2T7NN21_POMCA|nr:hypothetical protein C0Q70_18370 [Pomacea canaliculata]